MRPPCTSPRRLLAATVMLVGGCLAAPTTPRPREHPAPSVRLQHVLTRARQHPDDWRAQHDAGAALTREVLEGDVSRFDEARARLERAHHLQPGRRHIPRMLGRLLNLPLSEGDLGAAEQQRAVYAQLAEATAGAAAPADELFVDHCFMGAAQAAAAYHGHHPIDAITRVRRLERQMERRLAEHDDIDLHAMLGNYAQQIAGMTPVGRRRRVRLAIEHLEPVISRWGELSPEARGLGYGVPGVRSVFTYWLAELTLAEGRRERAHALYAQVRTLARSDQATPAMRVMADAAQQRQALAHPPTREALLPLWPSGYDSCIACHAHEAVPYPRRPAAPTLARR